MAPFLPQGSRLGLPLDSDSLVPWRARRLWNQVVLSSQANILPQSPFSLAIPLSLFTVFPVSEVHGLSSDLVPFPRTSHLLN